MTSPQWSGPMRYTRSGTTTSITVTFKYDPNYDCHAVYVGSISGASMSGTMSTNGKPGCLISGTWTATRTKRGSSAANSTVGGQR